MRVIYDPNAVRVELPKTQLLEALAIVMGRYATGVFLMYLTRLGELCQKERGVNFIIEPARFYQLMMDAIPSNLSSTELDEVLKSLPQILEEVSQIKHSLTERFVFQILCLAPILNPKYLAKTIPAQVVPVPEHPPHTSYSLAQSIAH